MTEMPGITNTRSYQVESFQRALHSPAKHHSGGVEVIDLIGQSRLPEVLAPIPQKPGGRKRLANQVVYIAYGPEISVIVLPGLCGFRDRPRQSTADVVLYLH